MRHCPYGQGYYRKRRWKDAGLWKRTARPEATVEDFTGILEVSSTVPSTVRTRSLERRCRKRIQQGPASLLGCPGDAHGHDEGEAGGIRRVPAALRGPGKDPVCGPSGAVAGLDETGPGEGSGGGGGPGQALHGLEHQRRRLKGPSSFRSGPGSAVPLLTTRTTVRSSKAHGPAPLR